VNLEVAFLQLLVIILYVVPYKDEGLEKFIPLPFVWEPTGPKGSSAPLKAGESPMTSRLGTFSDAFESDIKVSRGFRILYSLNSISSGKLLAWLRKVNTSIHGLSIP
jgi:hypothetical protein